MNDRPQKSERRDFLVNLAAAGAGLAFLGSRARECDSAEPAIPSAPRVSLIDTTDLYHPPQDAGDNFDLIAAYGLPEVDLKAVILDATEKSFHLEGGPRDPGFIPVLQLNSIFGRNIPCGTIPFVAMKSPQDKMLDAPAFQQFGIELLLDTLRQATDKVEITIFGSSRSVAVAFNRQPDLLRRRVRRIHLSAGSSSPEFMEWNVTLDPQAIVCLLRSDLPIAIYPCGTKDGCFGYGPHNSFWKLPNLQFIKEMSPPLRAYLAYAMSNAKRVDFLRALEENPPAAMLETIARKPHNVWETAVWLQITGRKLVRRADGHFRMLPANQVLPTDTVLPNDLRPCRLAVRDNGIFTFELTEGPTNFSIYDRGDPRKNEQALREALPALYLSFHPNPSGH